MSIHLQQNQLSIDVDAAIQKVVNYTIFLPVTWLLNEQREQEKYIIK